MNGETYQVPRLFFDWIRTFIDVLPGVRQPDFFVSNTPSGINRDFLGKDGYVPPNIIAMKLMNGGVLWLALGSFLSGMVGGWMNKIFIE